MATQIPTTERTGVSPEPVLQLARGFMASKHLFIANEVGLFRELGGTGASLNELAKRTGMPRRTLRILADAMVALGLVERRNGEYQNGPVAAAYLSGRSALDLSPLLRFWNAISYPAWLGFEEVVRTGQAPTKHGYLSEKEQQIFSAGVESFSSGPAQALATAYDFSDHRRILDLGGGTGSFLIPILQQNVGLEATLFELATVTPVAEQRLQREGAGSRVKIVAGDFLVDPIPPGHDAVLVANVIHLFSPQRNQDWLQRTRRAVQPGARLLLVDLWTDATHTDPLAAAVMAGEFLVIAGEGDVYSENEARDWLSQSGWRLVDRKPLVGPASLLIGEAV